MTTSLLRVLALSVLLGNSAMASPLIGRFASNNAKLEVNSDGFNLDLACAYAAMSGVPRLDAKGNFHTTGTFEVASAGPQHVDETGTRHPAHFAGNLSGDRLTLIITPATGTPLLLNLDRNRNVKLIRCL